MISLDLEHDCLIELLKAALFGVNPKFSDEVNWEKVFETAKEQCIVRLIASHVPSEYSDKWKFVSYQSKAHYMKMLYEQNALVKLLDNNNIPFVILKGSAAAIYYPNPSLRTFGDIDFYVDKENFGLAVMLLNKYEYRFISKNDRHYVYDKNGIGFELHNRISRKGDFDIDGIVLDDLSDSVKCFIDNTCFPCLPNYKNGLVLLWHLMHHLKGTGIGLRQIVDWMMFVHNELDDSAWENHFRALAVEAGLEKIAIIATHLCKKWLGLPDNITWCDDADDYITDQLLVRIFNDGNLGRESASYESFKGSLRNEGFFVFLQRLGMSNWKLAQRHIIFRPFAWVYQLCVFVFKGVSGLFSGKKVFRKDLQNMSQQELLKRLK